MCGIAGIIKFPGSAPTPWQKNPADTAALDSMSAALAHRGPDGSGVFIDPRPNTAAALIHRRLAIIDLPCGLQPMPNEDRTVHVVFNGEIYNHAQLRKELIAAGHRFATDHSDTEVLVHGWEQWGTDLPARLLGMFAFAIWDTRIDPATGRPRDTLFLARDRMGQKPLFYASLEDGLVFASTIPAILAWPEVPRRVPREQISLYLQLGFLPPPQTIWRDIQQLAPAHWLRLRRDVLDGNRYWSPVPSEIENRKSKIENPLQLRTLLADAVQSQLIADVPIACFLSGGVDSSIIALLMQQSARASGAPPIHTVSAGFQESQFDETPFAAAVAKKIGSNHTRLEVTAAQNPLEILHNLMEQSLGQPFADSSILPTHLLSKAAREIAPVALSGDGADELFGGYDRYRALALLSRYKNLARMLPRSSPLGSLNKRERYRRLAAAARESDSQDRYTRLLEIFPPALLGELFTDPIEPYTPDPALKPNASAARAAMFRDQQEYLPGDVLWKVDTAAMACALEVRSPFLDHRIVAAANALPDALVRRKAILRELFAAELPTEVFTRPKKGFAVPIGSWFRTTLRDPLQDLLLGRGALPFLKLPTLERLLTEHHSQSRDHTHRLFALVMLALFTQSFVPTIES